MSRRGKGRGKGPRNGRGKRGNSGRGRRPGQKPSKHRDSGNVPEGLSSEERRIVAAVKAAGTKGLKGKELARRLGVPKSEYRTFRDSLRDLSDQGVIHKKRGGRFVARGRSSQVEGVLSLTRNGDGFIRVGGGEGNEDERLEDVFVPGRSLGSALGGDTVRVRIEERPPGRSPVGTVLEVLERRRVRLVGRYDQLARFGFVVPTDTRVRRDLLIPDEDKGEAADGDIVVAEVTVQGSRSHGPVGKIVEVLGREGDPGLDVEAIAIDNNIRLDFPDEVVAAATGASRKELGVRTDRRGDLVFTIDPVEAKDHDDAVSLLESDQEGWTIAVHIADVSHYVEAGTLLDQEARERGTSVYLVDRVVPMLPEELSNDLCSLVPNEDRPAITVVLRIDRDGDIKSTQVERSLIRSSHRLSYQDAQKVLDREETISPETDLAIQTLHLAATARREARLRRGALDFDFPEAHVLIDENGVPTDIRKRERLEAHRLIEDLMLAANEAIARLCGEKNVDTPYRIHGGPTGKGLETLRDLLGARGVPLSETPSPSELRGILRQFEDSPLKPIVHTAVLRSLKRAEYSETNQGHFGLGSDAYLHFTSPIRRYPDLIAHRHVTKAIVDRQTLPKEWVEDLGLMCRHSSEREREADEAQRDSVALKQAEYMETRLGERFRGRVTGVTGFGLFVTLEAVYVEGLVHVNTLDDDFYDLEEVEFALVGRRSGRRFTLGDEVEVVVSAADRRTRRVEFTLP